MSLNPLSRFLSKPLPGGEWRFTGSSHNSFAPVLQSLIGKTGYKRISFGFQCLSQHAPRAFPCQLRQRISNSFRLAKSQDSRNLIQDVSLLVKFWPALTQAMIHRPSNRATTQFPQSSFEGNPGRGIYDCKACPPWGCGLT